MLIVPIAAAVLVLAALVAWAAARRAPFMILRKIGAAEVSGEQEPRLHNLVDGLCASTGVTKPDVFVVDVPAGNAATLRLRPRQYALVVTRGLLTSLSAIELEGVLAHELTHIRAGDTDARTRAITRAGGLALAPLRPRSSRRGRRSGRSESSTDLDAVALTRYPPALASGLERCQAIGTVVAAAPAVTAPLWLAPITADSAAAAGAELATRIEALREL